MYEHSIVEGVHSYDIGIGGDGLPGPQEGVVNDRQIFIAHDHAPEHWDGNVLLEGGKHYGHIEVDVRRKPTDAADPEAGTGFEVTITPVHVFPILSPDTPGEIVSWERRTYDDVLTFEVGAGAAAPAAGITSPPQEALP